MTAGLILGISILAGIQIYSTVLMNNIYESIIEGSPYEIRMDFKDNLSDSQIETFRQRFASHNWVSDAQVLYGNARTITETTGVSTNIYTLAFMDVEIRVDYSNETYTGSQGRIYTPQFYVSEIGQNIRNTLITGSNPYVLIPGSSYYNGIFISESLAESAKLRQGNLLSELILKISVEDPTDPAYPFNERDIKATIIVENVTIAGIMAAGTEASAGLFSGAIEGIGGGGGEIYIPTTLLEEQGQSSFLATLNENEMKYCAVLIDETKFDLSNPTGVSNQINSLINEFERENSLLVGSNTVAGKLLPFQIMSIFILIFDGVLTIPVAILSLYLLSFGIDLSLSERRYQVGVMKTQGAAPSQIRRKILFEALILAAGGLILGYIIAVFGAWVIGTATGFMKWSDTALSELPDFLRLLIDIDEIAFFVMGGLIVLILIIMTNGKSNTFISMEITESVRRVDETRKEGFLRRNNLDISFFAIGFLVLILIILQEMGVGLDLGPVAVILALVGPVLFWIGGAAVVARLAVWLPPKLDPIIRKIGFLKDVSVLIKGNVFRKAGDIPRLALIISLTVSFSVLAAVQGTSGEIHKERLITYGVGADVVVSTTMNFSSQIIEQLEEVTGVEEVMALTTTGGIILNDPVSLYSVDPNLYGTIGKWQSDGLPEGSSKSNLLSAIEENPNGCLFGKSILKDKSLVVGDTIPVEILINSWNSANFSFDYGYQTRNLTVLGEFNHAPGGIGDSAIIVNHALLNSIANFSALADIYNSLNLTNVDLSYIGGIIESFNSTNSKEILASKYLVKTEKSATIADVEAVMEQFDFAISVTTLKGEIQKSHQLQSMDYGIPGLLTADFLISLLAATLATFIFMSILMQAREKEFAILRSFGASNKQIYKIVFSETIVLLLTAIIWGLLIGLGLSVLFNGFFEFIDVFITPLDVLAGGGTTLKRLVVFDIAGLVFTMTVTFLAMLLATFLSVRSAAKAKISTVVREL